MRRFSAILIVCILLSALMASPVSAAGSAGNGPPTLERATFVTYPKDMPVKPERPGGGDTGKGLYKDSGYHWSATAAKDVRYIVDTPDNSFLAGIEASFQTWEDDAGSFINFTYNGSFEGTPSSFLGAGSSNSKNEVGWVNISSAYPNAIAVTMVWYNPATKEIIEVDMAMNSGSGFTWMQNAVSDDPDNATGASGYYDVQNIATHEAGHWLMLGDLYTRTTAAQTMYGYGSKGEVKKRSLESGDIAGVRAIYGS